MTCRSVWTSSRRREPRAAPTSCSRRPGGRWTARRPRTRSCPNAACRASPSSGSRSSWCSQSSRRRSCCCESRPGHRRTSCRSSRTRTRIATSSSRRRLAPAPPRRSSSPGSCLRGCVPSRSAAEPATTGSVAVDHQESPASRSGHGSANAGSRSGRSGSSGRTLTMPHGRHRRGKAIRCSSTAPDRSPSRCGAIQACSRRAGRRSPGRREVGLSSRSTPTRCRARR